MIIFSRFIFFCIFISLCNKIAEADPVNCSWCKYKVDQSSIISIYFNAVPGAEMGSDISISFWSCCTVDLGVLKASQSWKYTRKDMHVDSKYTACPAWWHAAWIYIIFLVFGFLKLSTGGSTRQSSEREAGSKFQTSICRGFSFKFGMSVVTTLLRTFGKVNPENMGRR